FPLGFAMDNVTLVRNLGHRIQMRIVPDPEFAPFKGIRIHQGDQPLILDGSHLNEAAEPQDYKIFVGSERCYVTLVDSRQLVCNGPSAQPEATDERGQPIVGGLPLVSVTVGRLRTELGLIEYVDPIATLRLWVLVVTALAALCSLLVLLAFLWKKRRMERERDYRKIQMQMEHLESNVRKECKQAGTSDMLFRKSDSVVEKMVSKWLMICLYDSISQYQAQKYSTLFKECLVMTLDGCGPFNVRAIACDTISQLKQKILDHIYKRTPHSQRPSLASFDLELLCPTRGRILLSDWSGPCPSSMKGPTKLNTLSHYGISNQSRIAMIPAEKSSTSYRDSLADSGKSSWSSLDRSSPVYPPSHFCHLSSPSRTLTMEKRKKIDESIPKSIPEVYLTRLLTRYG
ncbi:hypothetical protein GCK32_013887, partial [Trichostrongylus colubriformis]